MTNLVKIEELKVGTKIVDSKGRIGFVIEEEGELFFEFIDSDALVRVSRQSISGRKIKILEKI